MISFIFLIFAGLVSYFVIVCAPAIFPAIAKLNSAELLIITYIILMFVYIITITGNNKK